MQNAPSVTSACSTLNAAIRQDDQNRDAFEIDIDTSTHRGGARRHGGMHRQSGCVQPEDIVVGQTNVIVDQQIPGWMLKVDSFGCLVPGCDEDCVVGNHEIPQSPIHREAKSGSGVFEYLLIGCIRFNTSLSIVRCQREPCYTIPNPHGQHHLHARSGEVCKRNVCAQFGGGQYFCSAKENCYSVINKHTVIN